MNSIGERLRQLRGAKSQEEFADLLGIARKTLIRYELNEREPNVDLIVKLNLLYRVQPLWLLTGVAEATGVQLTASAAQLLADYERCTIEDQAVIRRTAAALAERGQARPDLVVGDVAIEVKTYAAGEKRSAPATKKSTKKK